MKTDVLLQLRRQLLSFLNEIEVELVDRGRLDTTTSDLRKWYKEAHPRVIATVNIEPSHVDTLPSR